MFVQFEQTFAFALITLVVLMGGAVAAFAPNIVHAAVGLFFALLGMAGYYFLLGADFLGITQVIIYVGGILVLLLFGILLTSRSLDQLRMTRRTSPLLGAVVGGVLFFLLAVVILNSPWKAVEPVTPQETAGSLGRLLLTDYLLAFEFSSITLLAALLGAAYLARRKEK